MDLYELCNRTEADPVYQMVKIDNDLRHYWFLRSMIRAALSKDRPLLSQAIIKAINFHAIAGLHHQAGEYRTFSVTAGNFVAPQYYRVQPLMDDMINVINYKWQNCNVVELAAYALWRVNYIHPFCNGNGRTARAVCYFIICVKSGGTLPGKTILPELLKGNRWEYIEALKSRDQGDVGPLISLLCRLLTEQLETASGNTR